MPTFKYEVVDSNGKHKKGTLESNNIDTATAELNAGGGFIISLGLAGAMEKDISISIGSPVKAREMSIFCRQFQSVLNAGVTVLEALDMLQNQTQNKVFKKTLTELAQLVQKGHTLAEAMETFPKIFPPLMIHMIAAGEASGALEVSFDRLAVHFEKDAHIRGLVIKAMIYPIVLILVIIVVVIIMMVKIVPTFTESFAEIDAKLPDITLAVMAISDAVVASWYYVLAGLALAAFLLREFKKTETGAFLFGRLALKLPLVGDLSIKSASARLARTLSTLMASGITLIDAIGIIEKIMGNEVVKRALHHAQEEVEVGTPLSVPLEESGVFPPMVYHMISIGEETGNMESMLDKIADYYEDEVEMATQSLLAVLEPLIIILMAVIVVPIILAIMMPMFSMYDQLGV